MENKGPSPSKFLSLLEEMNIRLGEINKHLIRVESQLTEQDGKSRPYVMCSKEEKKERLISCGRWYEGEMVWMEGGIYEDWVYCPKSRDEYRVINDHGETFIQRVVKGR
jgi:hypothetical protein